MATIRITQGSHEVVSIVQNGRYSSRLYVNVKPEFGHDSTATTIAAKHTTEAGMRKWAQKVLNPAPVTVQA